METVPVITKEKALELFGSPGKVAEALGITPASVSQWAAGEPIPYKRAKQIRDLKPEIFA